MRRLGTLSLLFAFPLVAGASSLDGAERLVLPSAILGEERVLAVMTPASYATRSQARYPVLYLTDGEAHLGHARATTEFLARNGLMPEVILVGIFNTSRSRDLTPTPGTAIERAVAHSTGGGERFLDFLEHELVPAIDARFRTVPLRLYAGHSLGGLLGVHALFTRPLLFQAVVAASPSLGWDNGLLLREARALKGTAPPSRGLYVTLGGLEAAPDILPGFESFAAVMQRLPWPDFDWEWQLLPGEDHGSSVLSAYYAGLRHLFAEWRMPLEGPEASSAALAGVVAHYQAVSKRWGYNVLPPEAVVNLFGYAALQRRAIGDALELFRFNVATYPESANAYDSLGEALERTNQLAGARESYRQAVQLAAKSSDPLLTVLRAHLDALDQRLQAAPSTSNGR
jgi:uncharacterized protein